MSEGHLSVAGLSLDTTEGSNTTDPGKFQVDTRSSQIGPKQDVSFVWAPWTDDADGSTLGGSSMIAHAPPAAISPFAVFIADSNDYRYTTSRNPQVSSGEMELVGAGQGAPGSRVTAVYLPLSQEDHGFRAILGEDFLQHFDILIDDQHAQLTRDAETSSANLLDGERLPVIFPSPSKGQQRSYHPMVSVTVPKYGARSVTLSAMGPIVSYSRATNPPMAMANLIRLLIANGDMFGTSTEKR